MTEFFYRYFKDAHYLIILLFIPFLIGLYYIYRRINTGRLIRFGSVSYERIILKPRESYMFYRRILLVLSLVCLIISASGPRYGLKERTHQIKGLDIVMAVDVSRSMNAVDIKPSRLEKTRILLKDFFRKAGSNRIGLVAFSGAAYVQAPLTIDHAAISMFLDVLNTELIPIGGTNIEQAIEKCLSIFIEDETKYKVIVLFTDGQETVGNARNKLRRLREHGVRLYIIGIAGDSPVPVPIIENHILRDYLRDDEGNIVQTFLVDDALRYLAKESGGAFYRINDYRNVLDQVLKEIENMEKKDFEEIVSRDLKDQSGIFLFLAFLFLFSNIILSYRTRRVDSFDFSK